MVLIRAIVMIAMAGIVTSAAAAAAESAAESAAELEKHLSAAVLEWV